MHNLHILYDFFFTNMQLATELLLQSSVVYAQHKGLFSMIPYSKI